VIAELLDVDVVSAEDMLKVAIAAEKNTGERSMCIRAVVLIAIHYAHVQVSM